MAGSLRAARIWTARFRKRRSLPGHSVQETPAAILELRRILRVDMAADDRSDNR